MKEACSLARTLPQIEDCEVSGQGWAVEDVLCRVGHTLAGRADVIHGGANGFLKVFEVLAVREAKTSEGYSGAARKRCFSGVNVRRMPSKKFAG
jgi:hypothetical protein